MGQRRNFYWGLVGKPVRKKSLGNQGVDGRIGSK
jgi:hypothetical protein